MEIRAQDNSCAAAISRRELLAEISIGKPARTCIQLVIHFLQCCNAAGEHDFVIAHQRISAVAGVRRRACSCQRRLVQHHQFARRTRKLLLQFVCKAAPRHVGNHRERRAISLAPSGNNHFIAKILAYVVNLSHEFIQLSGVAILSLRPPFLQLRALVELILKNSICLL